MIVLGKGWEEGRGDDANGDVAVGFFLPFGVAGK